MYSRALGVTNGDESRKSLEKFNSGLREQYTRKKAVIPPASQKEDNTAKSDTPAPQGAISQYIASAKGALENLDIKIDFDTMLIIGLILLILADSDSIDIVLLGVLASLIL